MKTFRVAAVNILLTIVMVVIVVPEVKSQQSVRSVLQITTHTREEIAGRIDYGSSHAIFRGWMETPWQASVQVTVNELVLDATANLKENLWTLNGYGMALSAQDRVTLEKLSKGLESHLNPYKQNLPPNENLLVRVVLYWSEAPVGMPMTRQEVRFPQNP